MANRRGRPPGTVEHQRRMKNVGREAKKTRPTPRAREITYAPAGALKRIEAAAVKDLYIARLALGLLECIYRWDRKAIFIGQPAGLLEWCLLPRRLHGDVRALINWALLPTRHDVIAIYGASKNIRSAVQEMRSRSALGKHFRARARRLMRRFPALPSSKWGKQANTFNLLPDEIGKPLSNRALDLAKAFRPSTLQVLRHDEPINGAWTDGVLTIRLSEDGYTVAEIGIALDLPEQVSQKSSRRVEGDLIDYFETGTEGVIWMLEDDSRHGREALEAICEGDHLTITDQLGAIMWHGTIRCDKKTGRRPYPMNPQYGQQCALGCWVHWIQEGFKPDAWASFFMRGDDARLRGVLVKKHGRKRDPRLGPEE
jgi:hypothetical protein